MLRFFKKALQRTTTPRYFSTTSIPKSWINIRGLDANELINTLHESILPGTGPEYLTRNFTKDIHGDYLDPKQFNEIQDNPNAAQALVEELRNAEEYPGAKDDSEITSYLRW